MTDATAPGSPATPTRGYRLPLSVAIVAKDEEANLPRCLDAVVPLAAEIVVVDSGSRDGTVAIALGRGARCVAHEWQGYVAQKNVALDACREPWVLCLDADEVVSEELAASIARLFARGDPAGDGYEVCRRTWYLGDWIRHVWYPEWRLRLVRRGVARWEGDDPHDRLAIATRAARLDGDLLHYTYRDLAQHFEKSVRYAAVGAASAAARGRRFSGWRLLLAPPGAALRQLLLRQGWRDGWRGWVIAMATAFRVFMREAFLLERQLDASRGARARTGDPP